MTNRIKRPARCNHVHLCKPDPHCPTLLPFGGVDIAFLTVEDGVSEYLESFQNMHRINSFKPFNRARCAVLQPFPLGHSFKAFQPL